MDKLVCPCRRPESAWTRGTCPCHPTLARLGISIFDRKFYNSLNEGDFGTGFPARQSLVEGDFWTVRDGLYVFCRGVGNVNRIDWGTIVHVAYAAGLTVVPAHLPHDPDSETYYGLRRVSETGKEEKGTQAIVKLVLDDQGLRLPDLPNPVTDLQVQQVSHDTIRICWNYWPLDQDSLPDHLELYGDSGTGQIDFTRTGAHRLHRSIYLRHRSPDQPFNWPPSFRRPHY